MQPETNSILSSQPSQDLKGQLAASQQPRPTDSGSRFSEEFERATQRESGTDAELRHNARRQEKASLGQRAERQDTADKARTKAQSRRGEAAETRGERTSRRAESSDATRSELAGPSGTPSSEQPTRQKVNRRIQFSAPPTQKATQDPGDRATATGADPQASTAAQAAVPQGAAPGPHSGAASPSNASQPAAVRAAAPVTGTPSQGANTGNGGQLGGRDSSQAGTAKADAPVPGSETRDAMEKLLVDREDRMQREANILRQIKASLKPGGRELSIRLSPASLGRVDMNLAVREGRLTATIRTESKEAHEAIERQLPELQVALENQGIEVMGFDLELAGEGARQGSFESRADEQNLRAPTAGSTRLAQAETDHQARDLAAHQMAVRASHAQSRGGIDAIG